MMRSSLFRLMEKDREWFSIKAPERLKDKIIAGIENRIYKSFIMLKWFKMISAVSVCLLAGFIVLFTAVQNKPIKMVFVYPDSGTEKTVHVVGTFNKDKERIPMVLDEEKGLWKATVHASQRDISDYEFVVEELPEEDMNSSDDGINDDNGSTL